MQLRLLWLFSLVHLCRASSFHRKGAALVRKDVEQTTSKSLDTEAGESLGTNYRPNHVPRTSHKRVKKRSDTSHTALSTDSAIVLANSNEDARDQTRAKAATKDSTALVRKDVEQTTSKSSDAEAGESLGTNSRANHVPRTTLKRVKKRSDSSKTGASSVLSTDSAIALADSNEDAGDQTRTKAATKDSTDISADDSTANAEEKSTVVFADVADDEQDDSDEENTDDGTLTNTSKESDDTSEQSANTTSTSPDDSDGENTTTGTPEQAQTVVAEKDTGNQTEVAAKDGNAVVAAKDTGNQTVVETGNQTVVVATDGTAKGTTNEDNVGQVVCSRREGQECVVQNTIGACCPCQESFQCKGWQTGESYCQKNSKLCRVRPMNLGNLCKNSANANSQTNKSCDMTPFPKPPESAAKTGKDALDELNRWREIQKLPKLEFDCSLWEKSWERVVRLTADAVNLTHTSSNGMAAADYYELLIDDVDEELVWGPQIVTGKNFVKSMVENRNLVAGKEELKFAAIFHFYGGNHQHNWLFVGGVPLSLSQRPTTTCLPSR